MTFTAAVAGATSNKNVHWTFSPTLGTLTAFGQSATYKAPDSIFEARTITITATSEANSCGVATATVQLIPTVSISISPTTVTLSGGQTQQFAVTVTGTSNTGYNCVVTPNIGTILGCAYTAPLGLLTTTTVTIIATSAADPTKNANATVTVQPSTPITVTVNPSSVTLSNSQQQQFTATVTGAPVTDVSWSISPTSLGSINSSGIYTAPANLVAPATVTVTAKSTYDSTKTGTATVNLVPGVGISVKPAMSTLTAGQSETFTATVSGASVQDVSWSISPAFGRLAANPDGSVTYTAPDSIGAAQTITVSATVGTKSATATINLQKSSNISLTVNPKTVTLNPGGTQQFTVTVTGGTEVPEVAWTISPANMGAITQTGLYTAPSSFSGTQTVTVTATLAMDASRTGTATITLAQTSTAVDVGSGAPNAAIQQLFVQAFYRGGFSTLVSVPPTAQVRRLGSGNVYGYYQTFQDANKTSGVTYALVKPNGDSLAPVGKDGPDIIPATVWQVWPDVWSYYNSIGAATAGYPTGDTQGCPFFSTANSCTYQFFDKNYAIFGYKYTLATGQYFYIRNLFYTKWVALGGMSTLGRPVDGEISITSSQGGNATMQTYANGVTFNITSGAYSGKMFSVVQPIYSVYVANSSYLGSLGLPIADEIILANGVHRQQFQGGAIDYTPGSDPAYRAPVASVALQQVGSGGVLRMNLGDTISLSATVVSAGGAILQDRAISWSTTNGQVVAVVGSGSPVTLKAVGGGSANVTASSEGKVSAPLRIIVTAPCCRIGEGAPSSAVQQAFQDAVQRNRLNFVVPTSSAVRREGNGYVQEFEDAAGARYLIAKPDKLASAYFVTGGILARYLELGGPAGPLGHPVSDPSAGGRQLFENSAALAGNPVRLVSGAILSKWAVLGYETGPAGPPAAEAAPFVTFTASSGLSQAFRGGVIYAVTAGLRAGQAFFVSGAILERYAALGGPTGVFGMPASDEFASGDLRRQNFEGGYIDYAAGEGVAHEHASERQPTVIAAPAAAIAGSRVRVAVYGFAEGSTLRVSVAGRPDFRVTTANGAYSWEVFIAPGTAPGAVRITATDPATGAAAEGGYEVKSYLESGVKLVKVQGDNQGGVPGAKLPQPMRVAVRDSAGNALAGVTVVFQASPGAAASPDSAVTDAAGEAATWMRLPPQDGTAMLTAEAPGVAPQPVTFSARAAASTLLNFPEFTQTGPKGALAAAAAGILRYHQNRGGLPNVSGLADPQALADYLKNFCTADAQGRPICDGFTGDLPNLWRAGEFVGGGVDVSSEPFDENSIRDLIAQGSPVLLSLLMSADGAAAGGHFVTAIGVAENGTIVIRDPNPDFARTSLYQYVNGFAAGGRTWKGEVRGAVRFLPGMPSARRFLLAAVSQAPAVVSEMALEARSAAGACGRALELWDPLPSAAPLVSRFVVCDGAQQVYQVNVGTGQIFRASLTDFASGGSVADLSGSAPAAYRATRAGTVLSVAPQSLVLAADAVVNAASFTPGVAPGGLISIFGSGLAGPGGAASVQIGGVEAPVVSASAFQVNAQVPATLAPGTYPMRVSSPYGSAEKNVELVPVAPAIFTLTPDKAAVVNQDGKVNGPAVPLRRGQILLIYATGLGAVRQQGDVSVVVEPVMAVLNGQELPVAFAGLAPGFAGVYQVNLVVPAQIAPGLGLPLLLRQAGVESNAVAVALE